MVKTPTKNNKNQGMGARWIRNSSEESQSWTAANKFSNTRVGDELPTRFMEVDGKVSEIPGTDSGIRYALRRMGDKLKDKIPDNQKEIRLGRNFF